jgi:hypothetical protein
LPNNEVKQPPQKRKCAPIKEKIQNEASETEPEIIFESELQPAPVLGRVRKDKAQAKLKKVSRRMLRRAKVRSAYDLIDEIKKDKDKYIDPKWGNQTESKLLDSVAEIARVMAREGRED